MPEPDGRYVTVAYIMFNSVNDVLETQLKEIFPSLIVNFEITNFGAAMVHYVEVHEYAEWVRLLQESDKWSGSQENHTL